MTTVLLGTPMKQPSRRATALTARHLSAVLARQIFRDAVVCPNCNWTGHEADLLVVARCMRLIDCEVKITRADLRADASKMKWWCRWPIEPGLDDRDRPRNWPPKIWKHYYAVPEAILPPAGSAERVRLIAALPAMSGLISLRAVPGPAFVGGPQVEVQTVRRARPNRDAEPIGAADAMRIARLASLRMWDVVTKRGAPWPRPPTDYSVKRV
jgi:hypothetical protein